MHLLLIVLVIDAVAAVFIVATYTDRALLGEPHWRFSLGALLSATTLATISLALIVGVIFR